MRKVFPLSVKQQKKTHGGEPCVLFLHKFSGEAKSKEYNAFPAYVVL